MANIDNRPMGWNTSLIGIIYKQSRRDLKRLHRQKAVNFINERNREKDEAAEMDSTHFWKLVNGRRKSKTSSKGNGLQFGNKLLKDPNEIARRMG